MQGACKERKAEGTAPAELLEMFEAGDECGATVPFRRLLGTGVATAMRVHRSLGRRRRGRDEVAKHLMAGGDQIQDQDVFTGVRDDRGSYERMLTRRLSSALPVGKTPRACQFMRTGSPILCIHFCQLSTRTVPSM